VRPADFARDVTAPDIDCRLYAESSLAFHLTRGASKTVRDPMRNALDSGDHFRKASRKYSHAISFASS
jgi:hypothetical protein